MDRYDVMPVFWREPDTGRSLQQRLRERHAGRERLGGAGPRGVTPLEGYLELGSGVIARSYDDRGRLVDVASGRGGRVRANVAPGGFTIIRTGHVR